MVLQAARRLVPFKAQRALKATPSVARIDNFRPAAFRRCAVIPAEGVVTATAEGQACSPFVAVRGQAELKTLAAAVVPFF